MRFLHVSYPLRRELCSFPAADVWLRTRKQALSDSSRCWSFAWSIWSDTWLCRRPQKAGKKALLEVACPTPRPGKIENNCLVVDLKGCVLGHRSYATGDSLKRVSVHVQEAPWFGKQTLQKRLYCIVSVPSTWKFQAGAVQVALSLGLGISGVPISALSQIYSVLRAMFWSETASTPSSSSQRVMQMGYFKTAMK